MTTRLWVWIGAFICLPLAAQQRVPRTDLNQIKTQADVYYREAAYDKAIRLYQLCIAYPNGEDKTSFQAQVQKARHLIQLDDLMLTEVRKNNYSKALAYSEEMLRLNPNDPYVKVTRNDLKSSTNQQFSKQDEQLLSRANELIEQGNWSSAQAILRLVDQLPNGRKNAQVRAKLEMVSQLQQAERAIATAVRNGDQIKSEQLVSQIRSKYPTEVIHSPVIAALPKLDEQYIAARRQLFQAVASQISRCDYFKATQLLVEAKAKPGFANDLQIQGRINTIRGIERQLQNITNWKTDPNKRNITVQAYKSVYANKSFRACIQDSYYEYMAAEAQMKQNGFNYAGAIMAYKTASSINPTLARRDRVSEKIAVCDSLSKCPDKDRTFTALMRTADQLYQQCNCDSAIAVWQSAKMYLSSLCPSGSRNQAIWSDWSSKASDWQKEKSETVRYLTAISTAESMFMERRCQQAKDLLVSANSINVRCGSLNRKRVDSLMAVCDVCVKQQCYDSLVTAAERSRRLGYDIDALKYYRQAKECVTKNNEQFLNLAIDELTCKVEGKGCPPNPLVKPEKQSVDLKSLLFDLTINGGPLLAKSPDESTQLAIRSTNYQRLGLGIQYLPKQSFISVGAGLQLERYFLNALYTPVVNGSKVTIVNAGIYSFLKIHSPNYRKGNWHPYLSGTYAFAIPMLFSLQSSSSVISTDKKYVTSLLPSVNGAIGLEKVKGKMSFKVEATYQHMANEVFVNQPSNGYNLFLRGLNVLSLGIGVGFR